MERPSPESSRLDPWTVGAIAVIAYSVGNVVHEGIGHGGACLLVGGQPVELNAIFFECSEGLSPAGRRWLAAGGSIANLAVAALAWVALQRVPRGWGRARAFTWLLLAVNLLMPFGYLLFSGIGNIGDWAVVVRGLQPPLAWRGGLTVAGALLYFWLAPRILMPPLEPFLGPRPEERQARARTLALLPYLVGGVTFVAAGLLNPHGLKLVLISAAAASFGGTSLLAWYPGLWARRPPVSAQAPPSAFRGAGRGWSAPPSRCSSSWECSDRGSGSGSTADSAGSNGTVSRARSAKPFRTLAGGWRPAPQDTVRNVPLTVSAKPVRPRRNDLAAP